MLYKNCTNLSWPLASANGANEHFFGFSPTIYCRIMAVFSAKAGMFITSIRLTEVNGNEFL